MSKKSDAVSFLDYVFGAADRDAAEEAPGLKISVYSRFDLYTTHFIVCSDVCVFVVVDRRICIYRYWVVV
jgi:hypothetical protein